MGYCVSKNLIKENNNDISINLENLIKEDNNDKYVNSENLIKNNSNDKYYNCIKGDLYINNILNKNVLIYFYEDYLYIKKII